MQLHCVSLWTIYIYIYIYCKKNDTWTFQCQLLSVSLFFILTLSCNRTRYQTPHCKHITLWILYKLFYPLLDLFCSDVGNCKFHLKSVSSPYWQVEGRNVKEWEYKLYIQPIFRLFSLRAMGYLVLLRDHLEQFNLKLYFNKSVNWKRQINNSASVNH